MKNEIDFIEESYEEYKKTHKNSSVSKNDYINFIFHNYKAVKKWYKDPEFLQFVKANSQNKCASIKLDGELLSFFEYPIKDWNECDYELYDWLERHKRFRRHYCIGAFSWPLLIQIIIPFFLGVITAFFLHESCLGGGIQFIIIAAFLNWILLPLGLIIGLVIYPAILKTFIFNDEKPYNEDIISALKLSPDVQRKNLITAAAGTVLAKFI